MDIIKKRITVPILVLLLIFVSLSQIPATFGKYVSDTQTGTLWESIFEGESVDYSDIFFITEPGYSKNLHGFDVKDSEGKIVNPTTVEWIDENGNTVRADEYYDLTKDVNISFPVYNGSKNPMLICFNIDMCLNNSLSSIFLSQYTIKLDGKKNETQTTDSVSGTFGLDLYGDPTDSSAGLDVTKSEKQYEGAFALFASGDYYLYKAYLNTYEAKNGIGLDCFILWPEEGATYSISVSGVNQIANADKIYSSINLVAVECDENGKPVDS